MPAEPSAPPPARARGSAGSSGSGTESQWDPNHSPRPRQALPQGRAPEPQPLEKGHPKRRNKPVAAQWLERPPAHRGVGSSIPHPTPPPRWGHGCVSSIYVSPSLPKKKGGEQALMGGLQAPGSLAQNRGSGRGSSCPGKEGLSPPAGLLPLQGCGSEAQRWSPARESGSEARVGALQKGLFPPSPVGTPQGQAAFQAGVPGVVPESAPAPFLSFLLSHELGLSAVPAGRPGSQASIPGPSPSHPKALTLLAAPRSGDHSSRGQPQAGWVSCPESPKAPPRLG